MSPVTHGFCGWMALLTGSATCHNRPRWWGGCSSRAPSPGSPCPTFERLAPPPAPELVRRPAEAGSAPGDIVADLLAAADGSPAPRSTASAAPPPQIEPADATARGGRARPPDLRHLDAAFSSLSASPHGETSLRLAIADLFATKCETCGRNGGRSTSSNGTPVSPRRVHYRCTLCRDQQRRSEHHAARRRRRWTASEPRDVGAAEVRPRLRERFRCRTAATILPTRCSDLHTDRQLVGLAAILARVEGDLRAAPVKSALRLAFLHAVLPASRLGLAGPRIPSLRIAGGTIRSAVRTWRERNPWLAFEDGQRQVRAFVQRLESGALGPLEARLGNDLRSLVEGSPNAVVRVMSPGALATLTAEARERRDLSGRAGSGGGGPRQPAGSPGGQATAMPTRARGSGSSSASHRRNSARNASARRTTGPAGRSGARRRRSCRWMRSWDRRFARRGRGRRRRSGGPSRRWCRISLATPEWSSSWSTVAPRR